MCRRNDLYDGTPEDRKRAIRKSERKWAASCLGGQGLEARIRLFEECHVTGSHSLPGDVICLWSYTRG